MHRATLLVLLCCIVTSVLAQAPVRTLSYPLLMAGTPAATDTRAQETLTAIWSAVTAKDEHRLTGLLDTDFTAIGCPSDPTAPCKPRPPSARDRKRLPLDRLQLALCCGGRDDPTMAPAARTDAMFGVLESLLQGGSLAPLPEIAGVTCSPAIPAIDRRKAGAIVKRLDIDPSALRLAAAPIEARPRPDRAAPISVTLPKGAVVPLLTTSATPAPDGWSALALPEGGIGYAEGVTLDELAPEALCLRKGKDGWKAALLIGRES